MGARLVVEFLSGPLQRLRKHASRLGADDPGRRILVHPRRHERHTPRIRATSFRWKHHGDSMRAGYVGDVDEAAPSLYAARAAPRLAVAPQPVTPAPPVVAGSPAIRSNGQAARLRPRLRH